MKASDYCYLSEKRIKMRCLVVKERELLLPEHNLSVDDLYTQEFYGYTIGKVEQLDNDTYAVNEVYDAIGQDYLALSYFLESQKVDVISLKSANQNVSYYIKDIAGKLGILTKKGPSVLSKIWNYIEFECIRLSSAIYLSYLMFKVPYTGETIKGNEDFCVIRMMSVYKKLKRFDFHKEVEYPIDKSSIYRLFTLRLRLKWICKAYISSFCVMKKLRTFYRQVFGRWTVLALNDYYSKRVVYAEYFRYMLDNYMSHFEGCRFYTADNIDRFSMIEDEIAHKHNIKTYNIPHGIEYGFKFPKGFSSDVFYANTQFTADYLNKLYNTEKYVFDESVAAKLFVLEGVKPHKKHIVFFTEPRDPEVNIEILEQLIPMLKSNGLELKLKLHPLDGGEKYERFDVEQLSDYGEAMVGNICIARKSTCLLEAVYNNSIPIAILINQKDKTKLELFPSLNSDKIIKTYSIKELLDTIIENY